MILQKSFWYADSMLSHSNSYVFYEVANSYEFVQYIIFECFDVWNVLKVQHLFETKIFCDIINVFTVTFDNLNASMPNKF